MPYKMNIIVLRLIIVAQILTAGLALFNGWGYLEWQQVPSSEIAKSPDAVYSINNFLKGWHFFAGVSVGMSICSAFMAFSHRKKIASDWKLTLHWIVSFMPLIFVLWCGRSI